MPTVRRSTPAAAHPARRRIGRLVLFGAVLCAARPAAAQDLADRIARAPDGDFNFEFATPPDVCGDGASIIRFHGPGERDFSIMRQHDGTRESRRLTAARLRERCSFGPARVTVQVRQGVAHEIAVRVGGVAAESGVSAGEVPPAEAVAYLLQAARTLPRRPGDALLAATLARADWTPGMLSLARDRSAPSELRRHAVFWVSRAAGEKATQGLSSLLADDSEELELRRHAVFALSQQGNDAAITTLLDVAEHSPEPELRKAAFFWLGQKEEDPRVMALFERILLR